MIGLRNTLRFLCRIISKRPSQSSIRKRSPNKTVMLCKHYPPSIASAVVNHFRVRGTQRHGWTENLATKKDPWGIIPSATKLEAQKFDCAIHIWKSIEFSELKELNYPVTSSNIRDKISNIIPKTTYLVNDNKKIYRI